MKLLKHFTTTLDEAGVTIEIYHNLPTEGNINTIASAFENWYYRTKEYTSESFAEYINSKGMYTAMTYEGYANYLNQD